MVDQPTETVGDWEKKYLTDDRPWDLGEPEPELVRFVESGSLIPDASVLELGCGTGTDSIYLAKKGFHVVGVDFSPTAIERAKDRARRDHLVGSCEFYLKDVCDLSFLKNRFDFAYDKTCFDNLAPSERTAYVSNVKGVLGPVANFLLIVMADGDDSISKEDLRCLFATEFRITSLEKTNLKHVGHDHTAWKLLLQVSPY